MNSKVRGITFAGFLLAAALLPLLVAHAAPPPPPPPTPPTPSPSPEPASPSGPPPAGGLIELHLQFPGSISYPWQELWTMVQWQDEKEVWHDVEGWQGTLDEIENGVGTKTWWVDEDDLGKGPFRWVIHRDVNSRPLVTSEAFDLPTRKGRTAAVEASLDH
jgi:hypothetical protein